LSEGQLANLSKLVAEWKTAHPESTVVSLVRFVEFAETRRLSAESRASASGLLASVRDASAAVEDVKLLGDRVLWYMGRYPYLLGQQTELTAYRLADHPEAGLVRDSLTAINERIATLDSDLLAQQEALFRRLGTEGASALEDLLIIWPLSGLRSLMTLRRDGKMFFRSCRNSSESSARLIH
jgi:hypothetical protein